MSDSVDHEIRSLQSIYGSERDPDGLAFAPLADAFRRKGEIREAFDLLQDGTSRHPDFATGHVVTAQLYVDWGFPAEAELAARRVLELDSENIVALSILGSILVERGDDEAGAVHAVLVGVDPESEQARAVAEQPDDEVTAHVGVDADIVDQEAPTVERLAIQPDEVSSESFDEAPGLPSEAIEGGDSLDMLGVHETEAPVEDLAAFEVSDSPEMDPFDVVMDIEPVVEAEPEIDGVMDLGALEIGRAHV